MWFGTMSRIRPSPDSRAVGGELAQPGLAAQFLAYREWSVTSYPCVEPGTASRTGDRWRCETPSPAR